VRRNRVLCLGCFTLRKIDLPKVARTSREGWKSGDVSKRSSRKLMEKDAELGDAEVNGKWLCMRPERSLHSQRTKGSQLRFTLLNRIFGILYRRFRMSNSAPTTGTASRTTGCAHRKIEARVSQRASRRAERTGSTV
jgi:hypothetical protein